MRGELMSDMGSEPAERGERRRLVMRGLRDRLCGIKRAPSEALAVGDAWLVGPGEEELTCRRCWVGMEPEMRMLVD
jgi:hypothetical protein